MLSLEDVHVYYGESHVVSGVSLKVPDRGITALLGRNGAGKTTTLRAIVGLTPNRAGRITFDGEEISRRPAHWRARAGIGFIPAGRRSFGDLTVRQNLMLAAAVRTGRPNTWDMAKVVGVFPKLEELMNRPARFLSGGEQQMLKFGRCLLTGPKLLVLDEPSEGLAPTIVQQLHGTLNRLKDAGLSVLVTEQNARFALNLADEAYLLDKGVVKFHGPATQVGASPELMQYLGVGHGVVSS
jgi:branched-chain amino acid transport system ATP-binding protein